MNNTSVNVMNLSYVHIARLTLQTQTPLSIGTGQGDGVFDNMLVRDANGLPAIPGSSFAGVLRHLHADHYKDPTQTQRLFGSIQEKEECPSRVRVSWGCLLNSKNQPIEGLLMDRDLDSLTKDRVLADALQGAPLKRDHVKLDLWGSASDSAQFDRVALTTGHRFALELALWSDGPDPETWSQILTLLTLPGFRLGGRTRSGLGSVSVIQLHQRTFDLKDHRDFAHYGAMTQSLNHIDGFKEVTLPPMETGPQVEITLNPEDFYRFGQGEKVMNRGSQKDPDLLPLSEARVVWQNGVGQLSKRLALAPASAVKGALQHRIAFHYNALTGQFAECAQPEDPQIQQNPAVMALFGSASDNKEEEGRAGLVLIDDVYMEPGKAAHIMHNGIDRFTGGVRQHVLYGEEVLSCPFNLKITLLPGPVSAEAKKALAMTLDDLVEGRLALGAGSSRGHGYFTGQTSWNEPGKQWLKEAK